MSANSPVATSSSDRFIGRVKWFNNKTGYGFITVTDGPRAGTDVFSHHSGIMVSSEQYKYLVQGEYVGFRLDTPADNSKHEVHAVDISGINGGKLMCETRREFRQARFEHATEHTTDDAPAPTPRAPKQTSSASDEPKTPRSVRAPSSTGSGPRGDSGEWKLVKNASSSSDKKTAGGRGSGSGRGGRGASRGGRGSAGAKSSDSTA